MLTISSTAISPDKNCVETVETVNFNQSENELQRIILDSIEEKIRIIEDPGYKVEIPKFQDNKKGFVYFLITEENYSFDTFTNENLLPCELLFDNNTEQFTFTEGVFLSPVTYTYNQLSTTQVVVTLNNLVSKSNYLHISLNYSTKIVNFSYYDSFILGVLSSFNASVEFNLETLCLESPKNLFLLEQNITFQNIDFLNHLPGVPIKKYDINQYVEKGTQNGNGYIYQLGDSIGFFLRMQVLPGTPIQLFYDPTSLQSPAPSKQLLIDFLKKVDAYTQETTTPITDPGIIKKIELIAKIYFPVFSEFLKYKSEILASESKKSFSKSATEDGVCVEAKA